MKTYKAPSSVSFLFAFIFEAKYDRINKDGEDFQKEENWLGFGFGFGNNLSFWLFSF